MDDKTLVERLGWHHEHPVTGQLVLRNPDGPEAATRIEALEAALRDAAKAERDRIAAWLRGRSAPHSCRADKEIADALESQP